MTALYPGRRAALASGPAQLFWFDIMGKCLMTRTDAGPGAWTFDRHVSAAGWVDVDTLLVATETST
jgi:hypothetical protein